MKNGVVTPLEQRRPILIIADMGHHLCNRMMTGAIDALSCREAMELLMRLWPVSNPHTDL